MARAIQPHTQGDQVHEALMLLGNPVRAAIIHELRQGDLLGPDLGERLKLPSGSIGPHLLALREAHVITSEVQPGHGRPVRHSLDHSRTDELMRLIVDYLEVPAAR